jgi:hypoxanthine phosphoribosyltransferase
MNDDVKSVIFTKEDIEAIVARVGREITADYAGKNPLLIAVLRGAAVFMADLMRQIDCPCEVDFMAVSSYGANTSSSGVVRIVKDLDTHIEGRDVIIVEDILDTGLTLGYLVDLLGQRGPNSIEVAAFCVKDVPGHECTIKPKYVGAHVPNEFVVGYGLDYAEKYRNLPYLGVLKEEVYS